MHYIKNSYTIKYDDEYNWIAYFDTIIFNHKFNVEQYKVLISAYSKLIFSNYKLEDKLFESYYNNNFNNLCLLMNTFDNDISNLPSTLTHLTFGYWFNQDVSKLPQSLTHLTFDHWFNQDVSKLPQSLTHLTVGDNFNQYVSNLPPTLTHLTLGWRYVQQYDIPSNIKYLKLNCNNSYIINSLPNSIVELKLGHRFNLQIDNLPTSIKKLVINKYSDYNADLNCLPDSIEELHLNKSYKKPILYIPSNLKKIICHKDYPHINNFRNCDKIETY